MWNPASERKKKFHKKHKRVKAAVKQKKAKKVIPAVQGKKLNHTFLKMWNLKEKCCEQFLFQQCN